MADKKEKQRWTNKQRVLVFASRGITYQDRHFLLNLRSMLPHCKNRFVFSKSINYLLIMSYLNSKIKILKWIKKIQLKQLIKFVRLRIVIRQSIF